MKKRRKPVKIEPFKIVGIFLFFILLLSIFYIESLREKKFEKNDNSIKVERNNKQEATQSEVDILYNEYITNIKNEEDELKLLLEQDKNIKFVALEEIYQWKGVLEDIPKKLTLDCGKEKVEFIFTSDSYIEQVDKNDIFDDWKGVLVTNKDNGKILQQKEMNSFFGLSKLNFNNLDYYIIENYTGGMHCCHEQRVAVCKNDKFIIGDAFDFGSNGGWGDFFVKNNQIYLMQPDGRFDYFNICYAGSGPMESQAFYKLDDDSNNLINVSKEFPNYYFELAKQQNDWLVKFKNYHPNFFIGAEELWYYSLIRRLTASYLSGESEEVYKKQFIDDFNYFATDFIGKVGSSPMFPTEKEEAEEIYSFAMKILADIDRATSSEMLIENYLKN